MVYNYGHLNFSGSTLCIIAARDCMGGVWNQMYDAKYTGERIHCLCAPPCVEMQYETR